MQTSSRQTFSKPLKYRKSDITYKTILFVSFEIIHNLEGGFFTMVTGIITLLVAILSLFGMLREFKRKNLFGAAFGFLSLAVFGWFSVMTITSILFGA